MCVAMGLLGLYNADNVAINEVRQSRKGQGIQNQPMDALHHESAIFHLHKDDLDLNKNVKQDKVKADTNDLNLVDINPKNRSNNTDNIVYFSHPYGDFHSCEVKID